METPDLVKRVRELTEPYDNCPLECDGLTRVLHTVLVQNKIPHHVLVGTVRLGEERFDLHFWIQLPNKYVVDYRAQMWLGDKAQHGVFLPSETTYCGKTVRLEVLPDFLLRALTEGC